jgi:hypothetical protein
MPLKVTALHVTRTVLDRRKNGIWIRNPPEAAMDDQFSLFFVVLWCPRFFISCCPVSAQVLRCLYIARIESTQTVDVTCKRNALCTLSCSWCVRSFSLLTVEELMIANSSKKTVRFMMRGKHVCYQKHCTEMELHESSSANKTLYWNGAARKQ